MLRHNFYAKARSALAASPVASTFFASLLISLVAALNASTIGRDASLYLDVALTFNEFGWGAAYQRFNWPWYSALIGILHKCTNIPIIPLAYTVNAFFMAGACCIVVKVVNERMPEASWWACLVVLAIPAFNEYRNDILREFGFWFFSILALYWIISWSEIGGWSRLLGTYVAILLAASFRLEALFLVAVVCVWQILSIRGKGGIRRVVSVVFPPLAGVLFLGFFLQFYAADGYASRLVDYMSLLSPESTLDSFRGFSGSIAESMKTKYSRSEAGEIAFFGIVGTILYGFLKSLGVFIVVFLLCSQKVDIKISRSLWLLFGLAFLFYFLVLLVFFLQKQYTADRYSSFLGFLVVPFLAVMALRFSRSYPGLGKVLIALGVITMLANVVSLGGGKAHYKEAAYWIKENIDADSRVYFLDRRIAFYAGMAVPAHTYPEKEAVGGMASQFDYFVTRYSENDSDMAELAAGESVRKVASFENSDGEVINIFFRK